MGFEHIAREVVESIERVMQPVVVLRDRHLSDDYLLSTLRVDLTNLDHLLVGAGLEIATTLERREDDRFFLAGVKVDGEGRVRFDDRWVHELFRVRRAAVGDATRARQTTGCSPSFVLEVDRGRNSIRCKMYQTSPPIGKRGRKDRRPNRGNAGPPLTPEEQAKAADAGKRYLDAARKECRDVK